MSKSGEFFLLAGICKIGIYALYYRQDNFCDSFILTKLPEITTLNKKG